jgi:hypothetical protein
MAGTTQISDNLLLPQGGIEPQRSATPSTAESDPWIFRDGKRTVSGSELLDDLRRRIASVAGSSTVLDALIEAGELEAALADAGSNSAESAARVTDWLASAVIHGEPTAIASATNYTQGIVPPDALTVAPPEGFTYYALHPSDFARLTAALDPPRYAVLGIRSIGTTLSAVVLAALTAQGKQACRITVRPTGHPYSRRTDFTPEQLHWINENSGAQFLIVDEGPGRSGSTFLSVAEALVRAGVPRHEITVLGSREPDLSSLCADNAVNRWREFRFISTTPSVNQRFAECTYAGGGDWRQSLIPGGDPWPASWTQMERLKFISPDWRTLYKFEGMGPIGAEARDRAFRLAQAGFGPEVSDAGDGFLAYELIQGKQPRVLDIDSLILERIADYCAFRYATFCVKPSAQEAQLREMLEFNVAQEFGVQLTLSSEAFCTKRPVITDGRMNPHEWILRHSGQLIKTDGVDHGDNHFFPGPCDIAWDLAGVAVEWQLGCEASDFLVEEFRRRSGVDVSPDLPLYKLAYSVFRCGFCKMAISTVNGSPEEQRLLDAYRHYRTIGYDLVQSRSQTTIAA